MCQICCADVKPAFYGISEGIHGSEDAANTAMLDKIVKIVKHD